MKEAIKRVKNNMGFTLIELLVVIATVPAVTRVAIKTYLCP